VSQGKRKSVYAIAERHLVVMILTGPVIIWGVPLILSLVGLPMGVSIFVVAPLGMAWVLIGGIRGMLIACLVCGKSPFRRGFMTTPIPERICSRCGADLTKAVPQPRVS
jgi:hypothetical protein